MWLRYVLGWGGALAAMNCVAKFLLGETDPVIYLIFSVPWLVGGYILGRWYWRSAEHQYAAWVEKGQLQNQQPGSGLDDARRHA